MLASLTNSTNVILVSGFIAAAALVAGIIVTIYVFTKLKGGIKLGTHLLLTILYTLAIAGLIFTIFYAIRSGSDPNNPSEPLTEPSTQVSTESTTVPPTTQNNVPETTVPPTTVPPTEPAPTLGTVSKVESSNPSNWKVKWDILIGEKIVQDFSRNESISFGDPNETPYFAFPGVASFRGDNYRTGATYGTANLTENLLTPIWNREISSLKKGTGSGYWSGCGWTGQPLIVQWDEQTRQIMNLYPEKKAKENLTEVIYATLDGNIYFYDLEDGTYTRDPMKIGMAFKGAGSLDPRGYPLMYVGAGDKTSGGKRPRMFVISLIDCSILYEYGNDDDMRHRTWVAFDSAPLVDPETDTLIWPGESGVLYTMKLNVKYDPSAGTIDVSPSDMVRTRYKTSLDRTLGYEASSIIVENYIYIADNGGMLFCVDLNTMELIWAQNLKDDNNATPVFEWGDDGIGYLYCATSMEYCSGSVYMYKINASTGEIVWETEFDDVYYNKSVSGGVLSSPVLGKKGTALEGMIIHSIARTPNVNSGLLVAMDTATGEVIWQTTLTNYCWSSPCAVYADDGSAKLVICDSTGNVMLIDPLNGSVLTTISIGTNVEASPAIFNDMLVVGTRGMLVYGIKLS